MFDVSQTINRWPSILANLGVPEQFLRKKHGPCPFCEGTDRFRFTDKDGAGMWICNRCGPGNGMQFVMKYRQVDFREAARLVEELIPTVQVSQEKPKTDRKEFLLRVLKKSSEVKPGDQVWEYLKNRGVLPDQVPADIRYVQSLNYYEDQKLIGAYQSMVTVVRGVTGRTKTLHVTYLEDGKKAPVPSPKKVLSEFGQGAAIRLYPASDVLCLTEGIETALAVHKRTGMPVWSLISSGNFKNFVCPDGIKRLEIWADHDANCTGQAAAYSLANRLSTSGIDVEVLIPQKKGTDWADE